ncbi:hypothetical protein PS876_04081 [Pseudomonas fluorescens]|uniref:hypothetical protein n=1 Tax=Pseudomonas fluorescens TaxID=294 RepID=UPI00123F1974|nr:hypothetical protein [Pseudomonas fluorescens]VVP25932.1 hypothetical protein PS876_04081 [Pseudomonas fluorescens]
MRILKVGIIVAGMALTVSNVFAAKPSDETLSYCTSVSEMAGSIMKSRQNEVSMAKLMKATAEDQATDALGAEVIKDAYSTSAFRTEENQKRAVSQFENKWFMICLKAKDK